MFNHYPFLPFSVFKSTCSNFFTALPPSLLNMACLWVVPAPLLFITTFIIDSAACLEYIFQRPILVSVNKHQYVCEVQQMNLIRTSPIFYWYLGRELQCQRETYESSLPFHWPNYLAKKIPSHLQPIYMRTQNSPYDRSLSILTHSLLPTPTPPHGENQEIGQL